ncbi:tetratricopeptide repeat protein [Saccharothrix algeriensis]|uniref:Flp pilus assembly protein TadD n=1 Tax=Saccharothrix algeriensis TaxID=173560 RepID=A0A8T8I5L2_9PSEU|nr:tetratricopeptide repeat protein [Saccharothrix algeriensis]MBM7811350.1 Flp pilus assembly protein TadD [Saccharothrix algeriensis]QTR05234.1 tetratricopeptide repeat protein [Saccharothrix algeriensis]
MTDIRQLLDHGREFRAAGDPSTAARFLAQAASHAPADRTVLTELALAHFQSAALGRAEGVLRELVDLDPSDGYARLLLGRTLSRQSRHAEALPQLRLAAALTRDPAVEAEVARVRERVTTDRAAPRPSP